MVTLYTIHADGNPVYLPVDLYGSTTYDDKKQITPMMAKLAMEDNKSGTLEFSIFKENLMYDDIDLMRTTIKVTEYVYNDDGTLNRKTILWKGRVIAIDTNMDQIRTFTCEGALAFLNDIVCYPISNRISSGVAEGSGTAKTLKNEALSEALQDYLDDGGNNDPKSIMDEGHIFRGSGISAKAFLSCIYTVGRGYNELCPSGRTFRVGKVTIGNNRGVVGFVDHTEPANDTFTEDDYPNGAWSFEGELSTPTSAFATALDQILDVTVNLNGGHLIVRHEEVNGKERMYLDYLGDFSDSDASAEYGVNIIEFNGKLELNAPVTDIIPRGAVISTWNDNDTIDDAVDDETFKIGTNVRFVGSRHYVASTSDVGYKALPGPARVTNINYGSLHPIHLIHTDGTSNVYGWVNQSDIEGSGAYITKKDTEFVQRHYESYPYTEYVGITDGYEGGVHVVNESLMSRYGRIQQIVDFPDIDDPNELKAAAEEWLDTHSSFLKQTYEVSLVDLGHIYGTDEYPIHLLDRVHVSMPSHGIDEYMPVIRIDLDLLNPANTTISFSKETNRSTQRKMARARAAAAVVDPAVELNQPGDSISQSMARNIKYISDTSAHAAINTSTTQNMKVTLPEGETTTVDITEGNGTTNTLMFVNGLLSFNGRRGSAPKFDIFGYNWKYIVGKGIRKPVNDRFWLTDYTYRYNKDAHYHCSEALFDDSERFSDEERGDYYNEKNLGAPFYNSSPEGQQTVYALPMCYSSTPDEAPELTLNDQWGTPGYGLYYRISNGARKYWATPCIYYLPSGYSGSLYVFCAIPSPQTDLFYSVTEVDDPLMTKMVCKFNYSGTYDYTTQTKFKSMFDGIIAPEMENDLRRQYRSHRPTYTATDPATFKVRGSDYKRPPCTAILIMPYQSLCVSWATGDPGANRFKAGILAEPAIIRESKDYTYINGSPRPNTIKIYNHRVSQDSVGGKYIMGCYAEAFAPSHDYTGTALKPKVTCPTNMRFGDDIKTDITEPKYYIFTSEDDCNACMEDYISGGMSQSSIEYKYRDKIVSINNGYASSDTYSKMQVAYSYNGALTKFYTAGSPYGDP